MAELVNLKRARKSKARAEAEAIAAENRVRFGRTTAQKLEAEMAADRAKRLLDQAKRES